MSFVSFGAGGDPLTPLGLPLLPGGLGLLLLRCRCGDGPWKGPPALREGTCLASPGSAGFPRTLRRWTVGSGVIPCFHWFAVFLRGASREEVGQAAWSWGAALPCSFPRSSPAPMLLVLALSPPSGALSLPGVYGASARLNALTEGREQPVSAGWASLCLLTFGGHVWSAGASSLTPCVFVS